MNKLYYTPPTDKIFDEVKKQSIKIWKTYDNTFGYVDEKVNSIKNMKNIKDNFMYMIAMFDLFNQLRLINNLSQDARLAIRERLNEVQHEYAKYY